MKTFKYSFILLLLVSIQANAQFEIGSGLMKATYRFPKSFTYKENFTFQDHAAHNSKDPSSETTYIFLNYQLPFAEKKPFYFKVGVFYFRTFQSINMIINPDYPVKRNDYNFVHSIKTLHPRLTFGWKTTIIKNYSLLDLHLLASVGPALYFDRSPVYRYNARDDEAIITNKELNNLVFFMTSGVHKTVSINYELRIKLVFFEKIGLSVFGQNNITNVNETAKGNINPIQTNANLYAYGVSVSYRFNPFEDKRLTNGI